MPTYAGYKKQKDAGPDDIKGIDVKVPDWIEEAKENSTGDFEYKTPSQSPFPVFVMCQPYFAETDIANNVWMKALNEKDRDLNLEKMCGEWFELYRLIASNALVYLLPPKKGLQDQVYVNSFAILPHLDKKNIAILSNFTAEGRAGEEVVAGDFLKKLGYTCVKPATKFEGFPELKYLKDTIYFGGYGFRTDPKTYDWLESKYDCNIIRIKEKDEHLYHLDCTLFVIDEENVMCCTSLFDKKTVNEIEEVASIHDVSIEACHESVCNAVRVKDLIIVCSSLMYMSKGEKDYKKERKKNDEVEKICSDLGVELMYIELEECAKSGAALSCMLTPLAIRF